MSTAPERLPMPFVTDPIVRHGGPTTASTRKTAVFVALLFLTATTAFIFADMFTAGVLSQPNFLAGASAQTSTLATGAVLLFAQFGVVGIAVLLFPLLKRYGESLALAHVGFRVAELAASLFYLSVPLIVIELSAGLGAVDASTSAGLGALLVAQHDVAILLIYIPTTFAGMCMSVLFYRSRLIPRWISILGLVGYPALLVGCVLAMFDVADVSQGFGLVALVPGGLFELILPIWLLARGFSFPSKAAA